jgi:hypothetical protein
LAGTTLGNPDDEAGQTDRAQHEQEEGDCDIDRPASAAGPRWRPDRQRFH